MCVCGGREVETLMALDDDCDPVAPGSPSPRDKRAFRRDITAVQRMKTGPASKRAAPDEALEIPDTPQSSPETDGR